MFNAETFRIKLAAKYGPKKVRISRTGDVSIFKSLPQPSRVSTWFPLGNLKDCDCRRKIAGL